MSRKTRHIAIVGAGASGLFLAKKLSEDERFRITVFEKNKQVGAKLRASGGGKANIFNREILPEHYNEPAFMAKLLQQYTPEQLENQFADWGLATVSDSEGRVYPATQFSQTVVDVLSDIPEEQVETVTEHSVQHIEYQSRKWHIDDFPTEFDAVVLASGSPAGMIPKNQRHYNDYLQEIALKTKPLEASLVGFRLAQYPKSLSGCRTKAIVSLFQDKRLIHREFGEITFKNDGVSGIVIMNLSAHYLRLPSRENCRLAVNLIYWDESFDVAAYLERHGSVTGLLHPKLAALYRTKPFPVTALTFPIEETYPMDTAQVCHGGIDLSEIDGEFASKTHPNLYILGEMLNMDGVCGGYNLFFAFASAALAAEHLLGTADKR